MIYQNKISLNTIDEAINSIRNGELIIVVDDEDRENEGDLICAAELITPEKINFMATHGRGLICVPLTNERCDELELELMVGQNTSIHTTPFTISVDLVGPGCGTGISATDRANTILALCNPVTKSQNLGRPGHIFPLRAKDNGVIQRPGHTEATIDLARLAGLFPAGVLVEIMNEDGTMSRLPELQILAKEHNLKLITIKDLLAYRLKQESLIEKGTEVYLPTKYGDFRLIPYRQKFNGLEHIVLIKGQWEPDEPVLVKVHFACITGDVFGSKLCNCGEQLHLCMTKIENEGNGIIVYINDEKQHSKEINQFASTLHIDSDIPSPHSMANQQNDVIHFAVIAQILNFERATKVRILSSNSVIETELENHSIQIIEIIKI